MAVISVSLLYRGLRCGREHEIPPLGHLGLGRLGRQLTNHMASPHLHANGGTGKQATVATYLELATSIA